MSLLTAADVALHPGGFPRLAAGNFGGITNRLRCMLTCSAFSAAPPVLLWGVNVTGQALHQYSAEQARGIFASELQVVSSLDAVELPIYNDWLVLSPEILEEDRSTAALCLDALNGDGVKAAGMLYQMPDAIRSSLRARILGLFSKEFLTTVERIVAVCRGIEYAAIAFRFWRECQHSLRISALNQALDCNWITSDDFAGMLNSIAYRKWTRRAPTVEALRKARRLVRERGIEHLVFMSDRWGQASGYVGEAMEIGDLLRASFRPGVERQVANLFVLAHARIVIRSKDSTFTHFPLLLREDPVALIVDI